MKIEEVFAGSQKSMIMKVSREEKFNAPSLPISNHSSIIIIITNTNEQLPNMIDGSNCGYLNLFHLVIGHSENLNHRYVYRSKLFKY